MADDDFDFSFTSEDQPAPQPEPVPQTPVESFEDDDSVDPFTGLPRPKEDTTSNVSPEITFPWMRFHEFVLVRTGQELEGVVDKALAYGSCALDLETEGFDNRIDYGPDGKPKTVHQIVGVCLAVNGTGYYIPVRHQFNPVFDEPNPNVPIDQVERALTRLCQAAQPILTPEGLESDPLGSSKIAEPGKVVIKFWNAKFDQEFLYPVTGVDYWHPSSFEDGLLLRYCIYTDDTLKLKDQAKLLLKVKDPKTGEAHLYEMIRFQDLFKKEVKKDARKIQNLHPMLDKNVVRYGCSDAICTEKLVDLSLPELTKTPGKPAMTYLTEKHVVQVIRQMERTRTKIDRSAVEEVLAEAKQELETLEREIKNLAASHGMPEFNPGSPQQLSQFLFGNKYLDIKPKPPTTDSGQWKTDADTLESLLEDNPDAPPVLQWILHYRQIQRIIGTYLNRFLEDCDSEDQLRFNFNQTGAATGRFTAPAGESTHGFFGGPIQGIPARDDPKKPKVAGSLRRVFVARPGYTMVKADYAGQELRLVTNVSGEPVWTQEFLHGTGDLHSLTARAFFNIPEDQPVPKHQRTAGKTANFALVYGGGVQAVRRATGVDEHEAARQKASFDKSVPVFARWLKGQHDKVKKDLGVQTAFGRWIAIPDAAIQPGGTFTTTGGTQQTVDKGMARKIQASCERKAVNYPIQGSGADVMKIALVRLTKELVKKGWLKLRGGDDSVRMLMTIHDEVVFEIKHERLAEALSLICPVMESPTHRLPHWKVPLIVEPDIGLNWAAKYHWLEIKHGKAPVPEWLAGIVEPEAAPPPEATKAEEAPKAPAVEEAKPPSSRPRVLTKADKVAMFSISTIFITDYSQRIIKACCILAEDEEGPALRLSDELGNVLIDSSLGIRVNPELFGHELRCRNLGHGRYEIMKA